MVRIETRSEARDTRYGRRVGIAVVVSAAVHAVLLLATPAPRQWTGAWQAPRIGYAGPEVRIGELNPQDFPIEEQERLATARRAAGALVEEPVEVEPETEMEDPFLERVAAGLAGRDRTTNPVIELGEDWALRSTSAPTTRTNEFVILEMVRPRYPPIAIEAGVEGLIRVQAWVDEQGEVTQVEVLESEVDRSCERETLRAMRLWKFRPYRVDGNPIPFRVIVPFRYRLE